ncbi:MAG: hypothetical protein K9M57_04250 [Phycisphaerae bacterium]|nr:hypothetical protein [Phycisphaerae bacterium]
MEQWQVQRGAGKCSGSDKELLPDEEYYAALIETQDGFERKDYCLEYWNEHAPETYCFWKTRVPVKNAKKKMFVDDGILINIFERLANEDESVKINFRFVLALILMRKRILKYEDSKRIDEQEVWKMRFVRDKKTHNVINPQLNDDEIEKVSQELNAVLHGEVS